MLLSCRTNALTADPRPGTSSISATGSTGSSSTTSAGSPSRGVLILPGLANNAADYAGLSEHLHSRGLATKVVQIGRPDWSRNAAALTDMNWWKGTLKPRPAVDWYLERVSAAMDELKREVDGAPITMLCHSAGGWLGRVFMLEFGVTGIDRYITLGSPHAPPPAGAEGVVDQTRGILNWCQDAAPGAYHPQVKYVTVAGRKVKGVKLSQQGTWLAKFAGAGYQQVCGDAEVWGDFIVPVPSAHLQGAINVDIDDCFHSPLGTKLKFFGPWYGSDEMVDQWMHYVTDDWSSLQPGWYEEHPDGSTTSSSAASSSSTSAGSSSSSSGLDQGEAVTAGVPAQQ